jgi:hypothetical protein
MQINLSNNTAYTAELVVYRDFINSNGQRQPGCVFGPEPSYDE